VEYEVAETEEFRNWRENLRDSQVKHKIQARIDRVYSGNFGDWKTEAGEVRAMRIDYGPGYRLYYVIRENRVVFLLCGGVKKTQTADINKAVDLAREV
jgi:putative addiction module killer protein